MRKVPREVTSWRRCGARREDSREVASKPHVPDSSFPPPMLPLSPEALFRYRIVAFVRAKVLGSKTLAKAVAEVHAAPHLGADGQLCTVSVRSIYRWREAYEARGMAGLEPAERPKTLSSEVLAEDLLAFVRSEKTLDVAASIPELLRRARERGIVKPEQTVNRVTVYRAAVRMGLPVTRRTKLRDTDMRPFAYSHRLQMVLADGKHFRVGVRHTRRVALFFLDDATRYGLGVVVGPSESAELFLRGFHEVLRRYGFMDIVYLDRGPGFVALDTDAVFAHLHIGLVLGTAGYPEGHGKIEKFNQTAKHMVLRGLSGAPGIDDDFRALDLRLGHYLSHQYNQRPHEALDGQTPHARWHADDRALRFPESPAALRASFVVTESRKVSNDNVVQHDGTAYEVPRGHAGTTLVVYHHMLDQTLAILHDGKMVRLHPVDLVANAHARRGFPAEAVEPATPPVTAAQIAFVRDFSPLVGPDGGLLRPPTKEK